MSDDTITGDIYVGAGETDAVRLIAKVANELQFDYPEIHYHISSGDTVDLIERLDKGLIDFGILFEPCDVLKYDYIEVPVKDLWGVLMRRDSPLADKEYIVAEDLWDKPLIISRLSTQSTVLNQWMKRKLSKLNIVATYSLIFNGSLMVDERLGYALCLNKIINTTGDSNLCFKTLYPKLEAKMYIAWKKYQVLTKASSKFLVKLQDSLKGSI